MKKIGILFLMMLLIGSSNMPAQADQGAGKDLPEKLKSSLGLIESEFWKQFKPRYGSRERQLDITIYEPMPLIGKYHLLEISAPFVDLQYSIPPGPFQFGFFAFNGKKLLSLAPKNNNFEKILAEQDQPVSAFSPAEKLAGMINDFKLDGGGQYGKYRDIVRNGEEIRTFRDGYKVDEGILAKHEKDIAAPYFLKKDDREILTYFVIQSSQPNFASLAKVVVVIGPDGIFDIKEELLTDKIFSEIPYAIS